MFHTADWTQGNSCDKKDKCVKSSLCLKIWLHTVTAVLRNSTETSMPGLWKGGNYISGTEIFNKSKIIRNIPSFKII